MDEINFNIVEKIILSVLCILIISCLFFMGKELYLFYERPESITKPVISQSVEIPEFIAKKLEESPLLIEPPEPIAKIPAEKTKTEIWQESIKDLINELRESEGIGKVSFSSMLNNNAKLKAEKLVELDEYTHAVEGYNIEDFFEQFGLYKYGENLSIRYNTPEEAVSAWYESETHRKNMLNSDFDIIGVAVTNHAQGLLIVLHFSAFQL